VLVDAVQPHRVGYLAGGRLVRIEELCRLRGRDVCLRLNAEVDVVTGRRHIAGDHFLTQVPDPLAPLGPAGPDGRHIPLYVEDLNGLVIEFVAERVALAD